MLVKSSFSVSLKTPIKLTNNRGFKIVKYYFEDFRDLDKESCQDFRVRMLFKKGLNIKECNYTDVKNN